MQFFLVYMVIVSQVFYEKHDVDIYGHTGRIAIEVYISKVPRYPDGSPIVVAVQGGAWATPF